MIGTALLLTIPGMSAWGVIFPLVEVIHLPYCQLLVQFGSIEQQVLLNEIGSLQMVSLHCSLLPYLWQQLSFPPVQSLFPYCWPFPYLLSLPSPPYFSFFLPTRLARAWRRHCSCPHSQSLRCSCLLPMPWSTALFWRRVGVCVLLSSHWRWGLTCFSPPFLQPLS